MLFEKLHLSRKLSALISTSFLVFATTGTSAALVDNGSYTTDTVAGLDWLDLSATKGMNVASALSSNTGWSYANASQVTGLLASFGISYAFSTKHYVAMSVTTQQAESFMSLLGSTIGVGQSMATLGGYYNPSERESSYLCISNGGCSPFSFTASAETSTSDIFADGDPVVGQFLVRSVSAVPEPETYAMLLAGLGVMGAFARRRKVKQTP